MSRNDPQFNLRIPETLRDLVMVAAKQNKRSATAEILDRLERSFTEPDMLGVSDLERMDPDSPFYVSDAEDRVTTKIHKDRLISGTDDSPLLQEDKLVAAMLRALRIIEDEKDGRAPQPNTGPKPRKREPRS